MDLTCKDCRFFLPVDVFGGLCKLSKKKITQDDQACGKAEKIAKCKFCAHYSSEREYLGKCMEMSMAYPDMVAVKCADFRWIGMN